MPAQPTEAYRLDSVNQLAVEGKLHPNRPETQLTLSSGQVIVLPTAVLLQFEGQAADSALEPSAQAEGTSQSTYVIPVIEERLTLEKRVVEREKVQVRKVTEEHVEQVEVPLTEQTWRVERVPVGRIVDQRPEVRQEGETVIYPVMEEQIVVTRQLVLMEEIHITQETQITTRAVSEVLRRERVDVVRTPLT